MIKYEIEGGNLPVVICYPKAGEALAKGGTFVLYTDDVTSGKTLVPSVIGLTAEAANKALTDAGLNVRFSGTTIGSGTVVYSQSIDVGTVVAKGTVVEIEMRYMQMG